MKATLEFNLPEEALEHRLAVNGMALEGIVSDLLSDIRAWLKHGHQFKTPDEALERVRELLLEAQTSAREP